MNIITKKTDNPCGQFLWTKKAAKPEALIMVETDSLSFVLSCCSIPFYIIGLIGNVLFIRIVHKTREMHTPTNYLLASMAVSDVFTIMMFAADRFNLPSVNMCLMKISGTWFARHRPSLQPRNSSHHYSNCASRRKIQRFTQTFKNGIALKWRQY